MERAYYLHDGKQQYGPYTLAELRANPPKNIKSVWYEGLSDWTAVGNVEELKGVFDPPPVTVATPAAQPPAPPSDVPPPSTGAPFAPAQPTPGSFSSTEAIKLAAEIDHHYSRMMAYFLWFICIIVGAGLIAVLAAAADNEEAAAGIGVIGALGAIIFLVLHIVHLCKVHYRNWTVAIRMTGFRDHDAGQAVGFLFIPLFNLYWAFQSYQLLAQLLQRVMADPRYAAGRPPNTGLATTYCVLNICAIIPYLGSCIGLVNIFIWFTMHNENRKATTYILRSANV